jgi:hypothetical protein
MKTIILTSALLFSSALASVVPKAPKKVDYSGFKVLRVASTDDVKAQIESLAAHVLNPGKSAELDVVVSPENIAALTALVAVSEVLNEDVGAALAEEGQMSAYAGSWDASHYWSCILNQDSSQRNLVYCLPPLYRSYPVPPRPASRLHQPVRDHHRRHLRPRTCLDWYSHLGQRR